MIRRLAEMGVATDASTAEFRRTRELPGWPAVEELIAKIGAPPAAPSTPAMPPGAVAVGDTPNWITITSEGVPPKPVVLVALPETVRPDPPNVRAAPAETIEPVSPELAGSFSSADFAPGGFACDGVSSRFILGDRLGRKLRIVADGAINSVDLTGGVSAGFHDVMALDIDTRRGDLWVASAEADGATAALHKIQLVSGRALSHSDVPAALVPLIPIDLTVTGSGAVLVLDAAKSRVMILRPGAADLEMLAPLKVEAPASLVAGSRDGTAYVAHRDGIVRIDIQTRTVSPVGAPPRISLAGIERLRRHGAELMGVQLRPDGSRRVVRLALDAAGQAVTRRRLVGMPLPSVGDAPLTAVCGDTMAFLVGGASGIATEWTFLRIHLAP
jgi:hypothetical protein